MALELHIPGWEGFAVIFVLCKLTEFAQIT